MGPAPEGLGSEVQEDGSIMGLEGGQEGGCRCRCGWGGGGGGSPRCSWVNRDNTALEILKVFSKSRAVAGVSSCNNSLRRSQCPVGRRLVRDSDHGN